MIKLKGPGHVTVNKPDISIIYIAVKKYPLCSAQILVDRVNPQKSSFEKPPPPPPRDPCNRTTYDCFICFSRTSRVHLQNNTFILRKVVENLCVKDYKNRAKSSFERSLFTLRDPAPLNQGNSETYTPFKLAGKTSLN